MKNLVLSLVTLVWAISATSQDWKTLTSQELSGLPYFATSNKMNTFRINPYDNSVWMLYNNHVQRIANNGEFFLWDDDNGVPSFDYLRQFQGMAFTPYLTYIFSSFGIEICNGGNWTYQYESDGEYISTDGDSVWLARQGEPFLMIKDGMNSYSNYSWEVSSRIESKNGVVWGDNGNTTYSADFFKCMGSTVPCYFNADTIPYLLDNYHFDFKFSPVSDTFYVSGDKGISKAIGYNFVDTLTPFNSVNMPVALIAEFEIDMNENIWAVFGTVADNNFHINRDSIGFYNKSLNEWTHFYSPANSSFEEMAGIELDTCGNLWVIEHGNKLHVLKVNENCFPQWLEAEELSSEKFSLYPNPARNVLSIKSEAPVTKVELIDITGKTILEQRDTTIDVSNLKEGAYFAKIHFENREVGVRKWIKK